MNFMELLNIVVLRDYSNSMMSVGDIAALYSYCFGKRRVVELGTNTGRTTKILSRLCGEVVTVDLFEDLLNEYPQGYAPFDYHTVNGWNLTHESVSKSLEEFKNVQVIKGNTVSMATGFQDGEFDCLFIDADHSREKCQADFDAWSPKVAKGGVVLFHDYCDYFIGVKQVADSLRTDQYEALPSYSPGLSPEILTGTCIKAFVKL